MKKTVNSIVISALLLLLYSCGSGPTQADLKEKITGKYVLQSENEFDYIRDTLEIKPNDQGTFDVIQRIWSSAKQDDPARPINKVAGEWNNNSGTETLVGEFQQSDTTLRITEAITGRLNILTFDIAHGKLTNRSVKGTEKVYDKLK